MKASTELFNDLLFKILQIDYKIFVRALTEVCTTTDNIILGKTEQCLYPKMDLYRLMIMMIILQVLEHWTVRKKRLEQCQQFALFERSARAAVEWIRETQERCGAAAAAAAAGVARESRERVRLLAQLADGLVEKGHPHAVQIKEWVAAVDAR